MKKPNIIIFNPDQWRGDVLGHMGNPAAVTPNLDQLAAEEGVSFSATVYDLTGITPDYDSFGKSLLPLLSGETDEHRDAVFCEGGRLRGEVQAMELTSLENGGEDGLYAPRVTLQVSDEKLYHTKATMCRTRSHKYIRRHDEQDELYDLEKDPREQTNLILDPAYADVLGDLKERMLSWYMATCDVVPQETDSR